ncbi:MAG TPA: ribonuclease domain-containing protein [Chitinophagaceae bacterium]|nr:ribonuclease domain-containing protein [Chitinophagaceae bacterium]
MSKSISQLLLGAIALLVIGFYIGKNFSGSDNKATTTTTSPVNTGNKVNEPSTHAASAENTIRSVAGVPQRALDVLQYVRAHGEPMEGYVGGRTFGNYEHRLPETDEKGNPMHYREWDVNPKIEGQNRGTERLITSANGQAWYTGDHYQTFIEIKPDGSK